MWAEATGNCVTRSHLQRTKLTDKQFSFLQAVSRFHHVGAKQLERNLKQVEHRNFSVELLTGLWHTGTRVHSTCPEGAAGVHGPAHLAPHCSGGRAREQAHSWFSQQLARY